MNEEIKIVIKAATSSAKKQIKEVSKELEGVKQGAGKASGGFNKSMAGFAKGAKVAIGAVAAVVAAIGTLILGIVKLGQKTLEYNKQQAKLIAGFQAMGASAEQAAETYNGLYRFLGESDRAVEAANHLALLTTNQQNLAEWTKITQGIYATFGDSLPIEGLTEAANETARVGKVVGTMADALNWAGVSEDAMNAKLATTNSLAERERILRETLNGIYSEAAEIYERNNKAILDYNESQAKLDAAMGAAGKACLPLMTALNNLGSAFFTALKPALDVIVPAIATFVNWIAKAVETVSAFFSALTGKESKIKAVSNVSAGVGGGLGTAAGSADKLASGLDDAAGAAGKAEKAIEDAKKATLGFDELNIVPSGKTDSGSSGGSGGGGGSSTPGYGSGGGGGSDFSTQVEEAEEGTNRFEKIFDKMKAAIEKVKTVFAPSIEAWSKGFDTIKNAVDKSIPHVINGFNEFKAGAEKVGKYLINEFVPDVVNSFSTNLAPMITDTLGFAIEEVAKDFEFLGEMFNKISEDIIIPSLDTIKTVWMGLFDSIGEAWNKHGAPLLEKLGTTFENIRELITNLYEKFIKPIFNNLKETLDDLWKNGLKPLVDEIADAALEIGECLLDLYNKFIHPIANWIMNNIYPVIVDVINNIVDIAGDLLTSISKIIEGVIRVIKGIVQFITGVFTLDWKKAWEGIKNIFSGVWDAICGIAESAWHAIRLIFEPVGTFFKSVWEQIKKIYEPVEQWFKNIFSKAWEAIKSAWSGAKQWFGDVWSGIKQKFSDVGSWFKNTFQTAWKNVQSVFSNWGSFFSGLWDKIKNTFSKLGTSLSDAIGGSVKSGLNSVIQMIERTINNGINMINSAIGLINQIPGVSVGRINTVSLPRLAQGGIVDSATIAMIGEAGKEAVLPLENNTQWMDKLADRIAAKNSSAPTKIILKVGERELGYATIDAINGITKQTGGLKLQLI